MKKIIIVLFVLSSFLQELKAQALPSFKVANILQSNMVIQQDKPLRLWGVTPAGNAVDIRADWMTKSVTVHADKNGNWMGAIKVPKAVRGNFDPHTITITSGKDTIRLKNVLIGEVWICSGQSNMTYPMDTAKGGDGGVPNFEKEIADANYPAIRLFTVGLAWEKTPKEDCKGDWKICSPETVGKFSAVGYYFGRKLFQELQVPIGLVSNGMGATACQAFTSRKVLESNTELKKKYVDPYDAKPEKGENIFEILQRPSIIYNGMIYPLRHLSIKGFIWYQGESNRNDGMMYAKVCTAMLKGWRHDFKQGDIPFYFVQLPPYNWGKKDSTAYDYALLREAQASMLKIKRTGMAVTMDVADPNNLHPHNKKPVGVRLARIALHKTYGYKDILYKGPVFKKFKVDKDTVKIYFHQTGVGSGLTTNDGLAPKYFFVAGADKVFHKAKARIVGNQVWLYSSEVSHPLAVRYAFTNYPLTNFANKDGLPARPFRTDNWK